MLRLRPLLQKLSRLPIFTSRVRWLRQTRPENCAQTVIAMALGVPTEVVEAEAGKQGRMTVAETLSLLGRLGIFCRPIAASLVADFWPVFYKQAGGRKLRGLGFTLPREGRPLGHAYFLLGTHMYDPATGDSKSLDATSVRELDWLALFPEEVYREGSLATFRRAMGRAG